MSDSLLFDLGSRAPTTRTLALRIRDEGAAAALDQAQLRADAARYQEVTCRSALNGVKGMPFNWTLNPYRGCTHACHYCFARRYQTQFELGPGDEFSSVIFVKTNLVDVLRKELDHPSWTREQVAVGTATDPYQPIEGHYKLTRGALEALHRGRTPIGLVTKGPMVVRDADSSRTCARRAGATVYMSVPTVDEHGWSALEPGTAHPLQRLARRPAAARRRRQRRRADGAGRPGLHDQARAARGHGQGDRRPRRGLRRRQRDVPQGRHEGSLPGLHRAASSRRCSRASRSSTPGRTRRPATSPRCARWSSTLQERYDLSPRGKEHTRGNGEEAEEPANEKAACEQAAFEW